ncbi:hypothetical protein L227DRAFT_224902 [Lentinus tigrinus ALCF2SS1-6]|uniref:F-box domain-containing protein n=1 Tax=Lentinus tigrinus ALCF2SS1-6 TaxID=1328759 RepID=A0A5C2S838_9APHY|nr:hypothetical protein L227DRAFT_224902 [Lentinus tigrinus ALCF2SS1-6]
MPNSPHPILSIPDILEKIFSQFTEVKRWEASLPPLDVLGLANQVKSVDRKSLACCARVCKAWSPSALDVLWAALPKGIYPLLRLFSCYDPRRGLNAMDVRIPELEWRRFQQYAIRVKTIAYAAQYEVDDCQLIGAPGRKLDPASRLLTQLLKISQDQPLLPNIRILHWTSSMVPYRQLALRALVGPCLLAFYVDARGQGDGTVGIEHDLNTLRFACPILEHLRITGESSLAFGISCDFANLRSAAFQRVDVAFVLPTISQLPCLEIIYLDLRRITGHLASKLASNAFPALRELTLQGRAFEVRTLLRRVVSKHLSFLKLDLISEVPSDVLRCMEALPSLPWANSLKTLRLFLRKAGGGAAVKFSDLLALLSLSHLEDVSLDLVETAVSDRDIGSIQSGWPLLKCLRIHSKQSADSESEDELAIVGGPHSLLPSLLSVVKLAIKKPTLKRIAVMAARTWSPSIACQPGTYNWRPLSGACSPRRRWICLKKRAKLRRGVR